MVERGIKGLFLRQAAPTDLNLTQYVIPGLQRVETDRVKGPARILAGQVCQRVIDAYERETDPGLNDLVLPGIKCQGRARSLAGTTEHGGLQLRAIPGSRRGKRVVKLRD